MGYWYPKGLGLQGVYNQTKCEQTFRTLWTDCVVDGDGKHNAASMNVEVLPDGDENGQQVDAGKISWIMAPNPWPGKWGHGGFD